MATNNALNVGLSGSTGSGAFVGSTSPTITTPDCGTPSTCVLTNATGDRIGSDGTGSSGAGKVGQTVQSTVDQSVAVSLTTGTAANVTSISLTAGDWDVWGVVCFIPANTTVMSTGYGSIGTTSATLAATNLRGSLSSTTFTGDGSKTPTVYPMKIRVSISGTTTVYLVASSDFATSTNAAFGQIRARRRR